MVQHSGIGTYIRGLAEGLETIRNEQGAETLPPLILIGDEAKISAVPSFRALGAAHAWDAPIYSLTEQLGPRGIPAATAAYHFPHYNVPFLLRPRRPYAVTVHDLIHLLFPEVVGSRAKWLVGRALLQNAVRRATSILTVSAHTRDDLIRHVGLPGHKIIVTPNAVSSQFQTVPQEAVDALRRSYNLPQYFLLAVGLDKPHKNLRFLVETFLAWRRSTQTGAAAGDDTNAKGSPAVSLVLCGVRGASAQTYPPPIHPFEQLAAERGAPPGAIRVLPYLPHASLPALYQAADALVFPSLYEGFGLPVLEAQRVGTPVLASTAASIPDVAGPASALYFDPRSAVELTSRLDEFFAGGQPLRDRVIAAGRVNEQRFSWTQTAHSTANVYRQICGL